MKNISLTEILDIAQYEKVRQEYRSRIIALKKRRRVAVGPMATFVFENRDTVLSQIQEMMRAERIVDDAAILHEIETYSQLLPGENELSATMFIELTDAGRIRDEITRLHGINSGRHIYLRIGETRVPGSFASGQSDDHRISAVQYVRFRLTEDQKNQFTTDPAGRASLVIEHPNYQHEADLTGDVRQELIRDLTGEGDRR